MHTVTEYLRNTWYVAAWAHEITADHLLPRTITHIPLVFMRACRLIRPIDRISSAWIGP
jgi:hypothetical protein